MGDDAYTRDFAERGSAYDRAMRAHPLARRAEFAQVIRAARLGPGHRVGDVPAGGGYLRSHLPPDVTWLGHEPCASFGAGSGHADTRGVLPLPWPDASLDRVISLAGVHHHDDKLPFHLEVARVLVPGGLYALSDVAADSAVGGFLDGFIGSRNRTGHAGRYLGPETPVQLRAAGLEVMEDSIRRFHWTAPDRDALADFCIGLFGLADTSRETFLEAADRALGIDDLPGHVGLRWELRTLVARKA